MNAPADDSLSLAVVTSDRGFALLEQEWDELYRVARDVTPFQSWAWMRSWWESYGAEYGLRIVTMRDRTGLLVGLIPLVHERRGGVGRLLFAGTGTTDYQDILVREGREDAVLAASRTALGRLRGWQVADLHQLRPQSMAWKSFDEWRGPSMLIRHEGSPLVKAVPWDELVATLGKDQRKVVRRTLRRAEADNVAAELVRPEDAEHAARRLVALHRELWQGRNMTQEHSTARWEAFVTSAVGRMVSRGLGELSEFRRGDVVIMSLFWIVGHDFVGIYHSGVSREVLKRYQWSTLLVKTGIDLARSRGTAHLDMLRGEHEYKRQWASEVVPSHRVILGRNAVVWSAYAGYFGLRRRLERYVLSDRCPPAVRTVARRAKRLLRRG